MVCVKIQDSDCPRWFSLFFLDLVGLARRGSWTGHIFDMEAVSGGDACAPCPFATGCGPDARAGTLQDCARGISPGQDWDVFVAWQKCNFANGDIGLGLHVGHYFALM